MLRKSGIGFQLKINIVYNSGVLISDFTLVKIDFKNKKRVTGHIPNLSESFHCFELLSNF